ncbi:MAG: LysR family transcriptional regulator [Oceanospirillaceae bacterium]|nr:LysR family transcriptional regulator [Oceanospirillaceae bacterium]
MSDQLDLRDLHYFETIATLGHVGKAAEKLHRSQPALTGCIRRIESTLGTALFEKEGRNIRLTPAGEVLLARARVLLMNADDIVREIKDYSSGAIGQIRIGLVPTAAHHLLLPVTRILSKEFPNVRLKTVIGQSDLLNKSLKDRELDLIIGLGSDLDEDFESFPFFQDTMVVVANSAHKIFEEKATIQDLLNYKWILAPKSVASRQWLDQTFELQGLPKPDVQIETNLLLMIPSMIMKTEFLSFISRLNLSASDGGNKNLREVPLKETTMQRNYNVIHLKDGYLPPVTKRLRDIFIQQGKNLFEQH